MKFQKQTLRRGTAWGLTLMLTLSLISPAAAAEIAPACDETYYATLDYYGGLVESSVVKSYRTNGSAVLTDYGDYQQVTNLTDGRPASVADGAVTFDLTGDVPDKFYFEGKTAQPYSDFPWTLSLSYTINGVPVSAEALGGSSGLVEIALDAVPNPGASEYSRNNLALTAVSMFNGDDILSLKAPGAQVQLVGNLYCVLFMVLPGEEQHFTIQVGSEDFSYTGMVFLAVPATLQQLEQVADLREAKEKTEDSYHAINDSMDIILNTLKGMSGSLNATASGLDQLNQARSVISGGKGGVYDSADAALDASDALAEAMGPITGHLTVAQQALTETTALLNAVSENITALKPEVENTRSILNALKGDMAAMENLLDELEDYPGEARIYASQLSNQLNALEQSMAKLQAALKNLNGISSVPDITVGNMSAAELRAAAARAREAHAQYEGAQAAGQVPADMSFRQFLVLAAGQDEATAAQLDALYQQSMAPGFDEQLNQMETANGVIGGVNDKVAEINSLIGRLARPTADLMGALRPVTGSLSSLSTMMYHLLDDVEENGGALSSSLHSLSQAADLAVRVSANADTALEQVQALTDLMNTYDPETQQALTDAQTLTDSAAVTVGALTSAARAGEALLKASGPSLDQGTKQALSGLSAALRSSTAGLNQTDTIRTAMDTIDALLTDEWNSHTGETNNLLLTDAGAPPQSLTDSRNEGTASIQYVMRSQEIKAREPSAEEAAAAAQADRGTLWSRIKTMFQDIWAAITGIF